MVRFLTGHYQHCSWPVKKASPGMCPCRCWTFWTPFVNKLANNLQFLMSFWFKWLLSIMSDFYCVDAWWSVGLHCLTSKVKPVNKSEWTKSKMLIFCIVSISWYLINICHIDDTNSHLKRFTCIKVQNFWFYVFQGNAATYLRCGG